MKERNFLARERARFAYKEASRWKGVLLTNIKQRVQGLPVELRTQGLSVTIATLIRDDTTASRELAQTIATWVMEEAPHKPLASEQTNAKPAPGPLLEASVRTDRATYLAAQAEALAMLEQIKLFTSALAALTEKK